METQVWDGGNQGEVSPGDTKGLVVFLRLRSHVLHVLQCLWHQPQPNQPHIGAGGDVGLGASRGGHTGVFPSVTSPPWLSPSRGHWCCQDSLTEPVKLKVIVSEKVAHLLRSSAAVGLARLCYSEVVGELPERHHHERPMVRGLLCVCGISGAIPARSILAGVTGGKATKGDGHS